MGRYGDKTQMVVDFATRMEMVVVNMYFEKREEHIMTCVRVEEVDNILRRMVYMKEIGDGNAITGENVAN